MNLQTEREDVLLQMRADADAQGDEALVEAIDDELDERYCEASDPLVVAEQQAAQDEFNELDKPWWEYR